MFNMSQATNETSYINDKNTIKISDNCHVKEFFEEQILTGNYDKLQNLDRYYIGNVRIMDELRRMRMIYDDCWLISLLKSLKSDLTQVKFTSQHFVDFFSFQHDLNNDEQILQVCADYCTNQSLSQNPYWNMLAGRVKMHELYKNAVSKFSDLVQLRKRWFHEELVQFIVTNADILDTIIKPERDMQYDFIGVCTLMKSYLIKNADGKVIETPQMMILRVAIQLYYNDPEWAYYIPKVYEEMSLFKYTHASPTLFNSCSYKPGLSSCFLVAIDDSLESIVDKDMEIALISATGGGLGIDFKRIRCGDIRAQGKSSGLTGVIRKLESTLQYVDQGGRRPGSGAMYAPVWHINVQQFLLNIFAATYIC